MEMIGRKCQWTDCRFCIKSICTQKDGGGIAYGMDAIGRRKHESQPKEVRLNCRCCIPDLGQYQNTAIAKYSKDELIMEAEIVEECGEYLHINLIGFSPSELKEYAEAL